LIGGKLLFSLKNISYKYKEGVESPYALHNVSFVIDSSKITALAGENGGGKTTLIKILLGRIIEYSGEYQIDNQRVVDVTGSVSSLFRIGYSMDVPVFDEILTGQDIIELVGEIRGASSETIEQQMKMLSEHLIIGDWVKEKTCSQYSTGMRKKVSIAVAYIGCPNFVILDEPLNGLDPLAIYGLRQLIVIMKEQKIGTFLSSHVLDFTEKIADEITLLCKGESKYSGELKTLISSYNTDLEEVYFEMFKRKKQ
jgi:ABC-type multidrug transport system ATPase subunit